MQDASYHVRWVIFTFGSVVFGWCGFKGALNDHCWGLEYFAAFLSCAAVSFTLLAFSDGLYGWICDRYSYNVLTETLALSETFSWQLPDGIGDERKVTINEMNNKVHFQVWEWYLTFTIIFVVFFVYAAHKIKEVSYYMRYGDDGLGAHFDFRSWNQARMEADNTQRYRDDVLAGFRDDANEVLGLPFQPTRYGAAKA